MIYMTRVSPITKISLVLDTNGFAEPCSSQVSANQIGRGDIAKTKRGYLLLFLVAVSVPFAAKSEEKAARVIRGTVFEDTYGNGKQDGGERRLPGVAISNQVSVMPTGADGS